MNHRMVYKKIIRNERKILRILMLLLGLSLTGLLLTVVQNRQKTICIQNASRDPYRHLIVTASASERLELGVNNISLELRKQRECMR